MQIYFGMVLIYFVKLSIMECIILDQEGNKPEKVQEQRVYYLFRIHYLCLFVYLCLPHNYVKIYYFLQSKFIYVLIFFNNKD